MIPIVIKVAIWLLIAFVIAGTFYILIIYSRKEEKFFLEGALLENHMSDFSGGFRKGIIIKQQMGKGGDFVIDYAPLGVRKEYLDKVENQRVVIKRGFLIDMPPISPELKHEKIALPHKAQYLSQELRSTDFGKAIEKYIEMKNADETILDAKQLGIDLMEKYVKDLNIGEVSDEVMKSKTVHYKELFNAFVIAMTQVRKSKKDQSGFGGLGGDV